MEGRDFSAALDLCNYFLFCFGFGSYVFPKSIRLNHTDSLMQIPCLSEPLSLLWHLSYNSFVNVDLRFGIKVGTNHLSYR